MCQKQCRDENGFKCHINTEAHQRQMLLFGQNSGSYTYQFSKDFFDSFMDILKRQFGTKRVKANKVYQQVIAHKDHVHMVNISRGDKARLAILKAMHYLYLKEFNTLAHIDWLLPMARKKRNLRG